MLVLNVYNLSEDWLWVVSNYGHATRHLVCQSDGYFVCLYLFCFTCRQTGRSRDCQNLGLSISPKNVCVGQLKFPSRRKVDQ